MAAESVILCRKRHGIGARFLGAIPSRPRRKRGGSIGMDAQSRIELLEEALAEYVARYGITEKARAAMIRGGSSPTNLDAESGERGTGDEAHSPIDRLPQG